MKRILLICLLILPYPGFAQNLVPNYSFEEYDDCPNTLALIDYPSEPPNTVIDWSIPTSGSSDYFNSCLDEGSGWPVSVPENFAGDQLARTGNAYVGIVAAIFPVTRSDYREYVQAKLTAPLVAGHRYYIAFYLSMAEEGDNFSATVVIDQLGAYLSPEMIEEPTVYTRLEDMSPQVSSAPGLLLNDTIDWMHVSGSYIAEGGEEWIILGNFTPRDEATFDYFEESTIYMSYLYMDDVFVFDISTPSSTSVMDTFLCVGDELNLQGNHDANAYLWDDGSVEQFRTINDTGVYWVQNIFETEGTTSIDTFRISPTWQHRDLYLGNDTLICAGSPQTLSVSSNDFDSYTWNTGETTSSIVVQEPGIYRVSASSKCYYGADTITLYAPTDAEVTLGKDINACAGDSVSIGDGNPILSWSWNTGDTACCINVTQTGSYILTATNECFETSSDEVRVVFVDCNHCIFTPTAFSPNGDGLNDKFEIIFNCPVRDYRLSIFNRWGQRVFSSFKISDYWDGTVNGQAADLGTYFYYLEATPTIEGQEKLQVKGDIALIR